MISRLTYLFETLETCRLAKQQHQLLFQDVCKVTAWNYVWLEVYGLFKSLLQPKKHFF